MKTWFTMLTAGAIAAATTMPGPAVAGDREWATAGKILVTLAAGQMVFGSSCAPQPQRVAIRPTAYCPPSPVYACPPRPIVVVRDAPRYMAPPSCRGPIERIRPTCRDGWSHHGYRHSRCAPEPPRRVTYARAWSSRYGWILIPVTDR